MNIFVRLFFFPTTQEEWLTLEKLELPFFYSSHKSMKADGSVRNTSKNKLTQILMSKENTNTSNENNVMLLIS